MTDTAQAAPLTELPAVAKSVHLPCKKCACDRYFTVVAHTSPTSAKVKCEVCGASKTFKLPVEKKAKAPSTKRASAAKGAKKKSSAPDMGALWSELNEKIGADSALPYNMKAKFSLATAINHPKFGLGYVTASTNEKIEVAFQEGGRSLVHNRT